MSYRDSQGRRWKGRRPNGWPIDQKAPDGFTVNGYRRVRKDKTFRFSDTDWACDFEPGSVVYVWLNCGWATEVCAVLIDTELWNPDTLNDNWRDFVGHAHASDDRDRITTISMSRSERAAVEQALISSPTRLNAEGADHGR